MTFQQMYDKSMALWDKAASPYLPKDQWDVFMNIKYNAWIDLECERLEENEQYMSDLMYLYKTFTKNNSSTIDQTVELPNYYKRIRFNMDYLDCNKKRKTAPIDIASNNNIDVLMLDPFNKPTDEDPITIATQLPNGNPGFQVFSTNTPLALNMTYVRNPQVIDSANNPNTQFETADYIAYILIQLVVYRMDLTIENLNRLKGEVADIQPQLQNG